LFSYVNFFFGGGGSASIHATLKEKVKIKRKEEAVDIMYELIAN